MNIAVLDDNIPDRKQLERLLKKASDSSSSGEIYYADSYGAMETLLSRPNLYDLYFVDMCKTGALSPSELVDAITQKDPGKPIVMCCSDLDYRTYSLPEDVLYIDKPIKSADLMLTLSRAEELKSSRIPRIELRSVTETRYVTEEDVMYALQDVFFVHVHLTDGSVFTTKGTAIDFFSQVAKYPSFFSPSPLSVANARHIAKFGFRKAVMSDGYVFSVPKNILNYAREQHSILSQ